MTAGFKIKPNTHYPPDLGRNCPQKHAGHAASSLRESPSIAGGALLFMAADAHGPNRTNADAHGANRNINLDLFCPKVVL
jgi:hypothetical protein